MKRTKHNLSHYHLTTFDMGQLVPVGCVEVLPGDSFEHQTSALVRVTPLLKPLMHRVDVNIRHFFVPNRLIWSGWEDFITGDSATPPPTIAGGAHVRGALYDYLGLYNDASTAFSALPVRAYNLIYNTYFRDQDLISEVSEDSVAVQKVAWGKDRFTTARPWPQKGSAVTIPIGQTAPVLGIGTNTTAATGSANNVREADGTVRNYTEQTAAMMELDADGSAGGKPTIYADLAAASGVDIREFREAFALQRYQEARSRYGSEYVDYLRYLGVNPSDARMQRPEYLGGGTQSIAFTEVVNQSGTGTAGDLAGHGISALRSNRYRKFFEEDGYVLTLMYVRPRTLYVSPCPRKFTRDTKEDYYQKELEHIGVDEILNRELSAYHSTPEGVFGYGERYQEYREESSRVSAEMRDFNNWDFHMGRILDTTPALNQSFVECDPEKRVFAEQTLNSLWVQCNHRLVARRRVGRPGVPKLV